MFPASSLYSIALAAISLIGVVSAIPTPDVPKTLPFRTNINTTGLLPEIDLARAATFLLGDLLNVGDIIGKRDGSISVTNTAVTYTASVGVGSPATYYNLLIDTGSANTWVGAGKKYLQTSTSSSTGQSVSVSYGSGEFKGNEYTDTVTLSSSLIINGQSIGVVSGSGGSQGFSGVDGILGIGPVDLTTNTVSGTYLVPTVTDNLYSQGTISSEVIGISYEPFTSTSGNSGELTFGGTDPSKYTGSITYVPITSQYPSSYYWGIDQSILYGGEPILSSGSGVVDTGTTLILLASDVFEKYQAMTGAQHDEYTGMLSINQAQYAKLSNLDFNIGGTTFSLTPDAQIWPRALNREIGGSPDRVYLIVANLGTKSGNGLDFINGYGFLERFYSVYDMTNKRIGFAQTAQTDSTSN